MVTPIGTIPSVPITDSTPGVNPHDFIAANRIHVKGGSIFVSGNLVVHPAELAPENEAALREKLHLTESINHPSFYESSKRLAIALNLSQLVPVSLEAQDSKLRNEIDAFNKRVDTGAADDLQKLYDDKLHPFAAIVRDTLEKPKQDAVGTETLKNGVAMFLLMREKLNRARELNPLTTYVSHTRTPDQVLSDLQDKIGVSPLQVREAALKGGIEAVGALLGLDAAYVADVKELTNTVAARDFSLNLIEQWHLGRQLLHGQPATLDQKVALGIEARITKQIHDLRERAHGLTEVPDAAKRMQREVAESLKLVDPIQRAIMYKLGYEICYTPDMFADDIAKYPGIYGLHVKAANDARDVKGTYRIFISGRGDLKGSMRTRVHEIAHNLWPEAFTASEVATIDALAKSDAVRFANLDRMLREKFPEFEQIVNEYQAAADDASKAQVVAKAKAAFASYGVSVDEGLLPYVRSAHDFQYMVRHAHETLNSEGARYAKSGYDRPHESFREVVSSRFAELKQVEYAAEPQLLQYLAPGLNQIWEAYYIPHLHRVYDRLVAMETPAANTATLNPSAVASLPTPANDAAMGLVATPPTAAASAAAPTGGVAMAASPCIAHDGVPATTIDAQTADMPSLMDERNVAALRTLSAMGIAAR